MNPFESEEEEETAEAEWDIQDDTTSDAGHWDGAEGESEQWGTRRGSARRRVAEETGGNGARLVAAERERAGLRAAGAGKVAEDRDAEDVEQVSSHEILEHMLRPEDGLVERSMPCTLRSRLVCELWHGGELAASR